MNKRINVTKLSVLLLLFAGDSGWSPTKREVTDKLLEGEKGNRNDAKGPLQTRPPNWGWGKRGVAPSFTISPPCPVSRLREARALIAERVAAKDSFICPTYVHTETIRHLLVFYFHPL